MNITQRLTTLSTHMRFQSNPAAQRFADTGHPGRALGHENARPDPAGMQVPRAQGLLDRQVMDKLNSQLNAAGVALPETLAAEDFTPEAVAERILGNVRGALAGLEGEARSEGLAQIRTAIEQGISEAREILQSIGALQGAVAEQLDQTEAMLFKGLDALGVPTADTYTQAPVAGNADLAPPVPGNTPGPDRMSRRPAESNFFSYTSTQRSQNSSIEIRTRDGDVVTVDLMRSRSRDQATVRSQNAGGEAFYKEVNFSRSSSMEFSVQGELDADEQKAIDQLLKRIDKVANRFFEGNVQSAFKKAASLKMDAGELASFSMDMSSSVTRQKVTAYSATAANGASAPAANPLEQMTQFLGEVRDTLEDVNAALFAEPPKAVADLINGVADAKTGDVAMADEEAAALDLMKATVNEMQKPGSAQAGVLETEQAA